MKKFLITLIFLTISSVSFAEQGQIKQNGFFAGTSKVLGDDKGNFTIIYDGVLGLKALEGTTFGDKSSMRCVGSIVGFAGQGYESGTCVNKLVDTMINDGLLDSFNDYHMGVTAENVAEKYKISRDEQDNFSLNSQKDMEEI